MEKLKKNLAIVLFAILIFNLSFSQNPEWVNFTANGNYINALAIEGDYIWVGTNGGGLVKLNMLTGEKVNYTKGSGLPSNYVLAIAIDGQGNKWIGTWEGGLAKFDGVNWTVYNTSNSGLPDDYVYAITIDGLGNKWIGTWRGGLVKFDGVSWTVYNTSNSGLRSNYVYAIAIDVQGNKWIGTVGGGLAKFDGVSWTVYNTSNSGLRSNYVYAIAIDVQGNKWIGTDGGGLAKFDGVSWTVYNTSNSGLPDNYVRAIAIDEQGNKWIGTSGGGLARFDGVSWTVYNTSNSGLRSNYVYAIAIDVQGNKWIGTDGGGLAKFDGVSWTVYNTSNSGLPSNNVLAIAIDVQGNKWIGTGGGLAKFDGVSWTVYNRSNSGLPDNRVNAIAIDIQGNKWIGTGGGLAKFDGVNWTVYNTSNSGLPDNRVNAIAIDIQGNKWIGTGGGLAKFDGVNWRVYNTSNSGLPHNSVRAITIDGQGNKWIGTGGGLAKFDGVNWTVYNRSNSDLSGDTISAISIDMQGNKWIGTSNGLVKFDGVNWRIYNTSNSGLPSNNVLAIAIDVQGNKWIGTGGGLAKFDGVNWRVYKTSSSGLPRDYVNAIAADGQGNKWIGTSGGLAVYREGGVVLPYAYFYSNSLDFDRIYLNEVKSLKLKVENRGIGTLMITGVSIADTSFRFLGDLPLVLNPGDAGFLNFSFKPSSSGFYVDTAFIYSNSPDSVFRLVLKGRGVKPPYLSSYVDSIDFGAVLIGDTVIKFLKLYNLGEIDTIRVVKLEISEPFSVVLSSNVINPGDSLNVILRFKPLSGRVYDGLLKVISTAWNDTLEIKVHGKGMPVVLNTNRRVQSGVVKFICRFNAVDSVKLKSFFYSVDGGSSWRLSSSVSSFAGIGVGVDTIYWDSKVDLNNFESANVAVRMDFSISSFDFSVRIDSVGVDNLAPRFRGVKSYENLPFGKIVLYWDKAVDISQVRYKVFVSDSLVFSGVEVDSAFVSGLRTSTNYNFIIRVSDLFGNESFSSYSVKVNALCDYNGDGKIDAFDLGRYVKSWSELDYSGSDIYPYDGSLPYVIVLGDGKLDVYDVFTFTKIWDYSHTQGLPKVLSFDGFDFAYLTSGGEFVFKPDISGDFVSYGFEIIHRGVKVDSFNVLRDGISLVFMDSLRDVIYFDYSKFGGIKEDGLELFRIKFGGFGSGDSVVVKFYVYDGNSLSLGKEVLKKVYVLKFDDMPKEFRLYQNYPNPFNPSTFIKFDLPREAKVKLSVYDVMGRLVRVLVDEQMQAGRYRVEFRGDGLASGVYFYRLEAGEFVSVKKMVLVK